MKNVYALESDLPAIFFSLRKYATAQDYRLESQPLFIKLEKL